MTLHSHTGFGEPIRYSASAFIGSAVGKLGREGLLLRRPCKATGYWGYNGTLNAWALPPGPADDTVISWSNFATAQGLEPGAWPRSLLE